MTLNSVHIFSVNKSAPGMYESLFGGLFIHPLAPNVARVGLLGSSLLALTLLFIQLYSKKKNLSYWIYFLSLCSFTALCFLIGLPLDEIFVNLRHSMNFALDNSFSFNRLNNIEGTVDFLPYFVLGLFAKLGLPLAEMAFLQSWAGGIACILAGHSLAKHSKLSTEYRSLTVFILAHFPAISINSATGFSTTIFASAILWAIIFLFYSNSTRLGWILTSIIPLIRLEGAFFVALIWTVKFISERRNAPFSTLFRRQLKLGMLLILPTLAISIFRFWKFGSPIPLPVTFKASLGNLFYFKIGMHALFSDLSSLLTWIPLAILSISLLVKSGDGTPNQKAWRPPLLSLGIFCFPYYTSGGDWFFNMPLGRYVLPLVLFAWTIAIILILQAIQHTHKRTIQICSAVLCVGLLINLNYPLNCLTFTKNWLLSWMAGRGNFRMQQISRLGLHLKETTPKQFTIATSEVATLMYYANREGLDLLGVANPEIAKAPLIESSATMYKRRKPELIATLRPEILWPSGYTGFVPFGASREIILKKLNEFHVKNLSDNRFRFGGVKNTLNIGYQLVAILFSDNFFSVYLVANEAADTHFKSLTEKGFNRL